MTDKIDNGDSWLKKIEELIRLKTDKIKINVFDIGKLLTEVKSRLPHGQFKKWVKNQDALVLTL